MVDPSDLVFHSCLDRGQMHSPKMSAVRRRYFRPMDCVGVIRWFKSLASTSASVGSLNLGFVASPYSPLLTTLPGNDFLVPFLTDTSIFAGTNLTRVGEKAII